MNKTVARPIFILLISLSVFVLFDFFRFYQSPLIPKNTRLTYYFEPGNNLKHLTSDFRIMQFLKKPLYFTALSKFKNLSVSLQAGEYEFNGPVFPMELLLTLKRGETTSHSFTIIEGWTVDDMLAALSFEPRLNGQPLVVDDLKNTFIADGGNPEGYFYPDTYQFQTGHDKLMVLQIAFEKMQTVLSYEWGSRAEGLPYKSPSDALIVASLIERETSIDSEKIKVAGVIVRRLQKRMRLQIDPTIIYGLGKRYTGTLTKKDLQKDGPYNTYTRYGLPPTPIALPSQSSIHAALNPDNGDALYFVARGDGGHEFTASLEAHNLAVKQYIGTNHGKN